MLGRFLEISLGTPDILASLAFYESLGFIQVSTNEIRPYPYTVVTDGRLFLGLHAQLHGGPTLSFVHAELQSHRTTLQTRGLALDQERLGQDVFNELRFHDPNGWGVQLLEARTFSPPAIDPTFTSQCGYFLEWGLPVKDYAAACAFWEALGFVALAEEHSPWPRLTLTSHHLNLGLYRSRALRHPTLVFEDAQMPARLTQLRARGFTVLDEMPDGLDEGSNGVLIAPEGTRLLLMQSTQ